MSLMTGPRGSGKTTQAILRAKYKPEAILVVENKEIKELAISHGVDSDKVLTHMDILFNNHVRYDGDYIIDGAENLLRLILKGNKLDFVTINSDGNVYQDYK